MINETYILYSVLAVNTVLLLIACGSLLHINARCRRLEEFKLSLLEKREGPSDQVDLSGYVEVLKGLERRLVEVQQSVEAAASGPAAEARRVTPSMPIENALRMAKLGASIDDLTRNCGLNIGEARLMQKLHGKAQAAAKAV